MRALFLTVAIVVSALVFRGDAFAKTARCPCNPCPCAPCTCGESKSSSSKPQPTKTAGPAKSVPSKTQTAKTETPMTQSKPHQAKKEHGHGHSHSGVEAGIGASIDLGGIGQRRAEPDPFAVPAGPQPVTARTEEKPPPAKKPRKVAESDPFAGVQLTGPQAKGESNP